MNYLESYLEFVTSIRPTLMCNDDSVDGIYVEDLDPLANESTESNTSVAHASSDEQDSIIVQEINPKEDFVALDFSANYSTSPNISCDENSRSSTAACLPLTTQKPQAPRKALKCNTCEFKTRSKRDLKKHYIEIHDLMLVKKAGASDKTNLRPVAYWPEPSGTVVLESESQSLPLEPTKPINADFPFNQQIVLSVDGNLLEMKTKVEGNLTLVDLEHAAGLDGFVKLDDLVAGQAVMGEQV